MGDRFQIRHHEMGVYQGEFLGMCFWHPMSNVPDMGFCDFSCQAEAGQFIDLFCSYTGHDPGEFSVEPFDETESDRLILAGARALQS
jgi:hypothetical protein